jgi:hypothetical protein
MDRRLAGEDSGDRTHTPGNRARKNSCENKEEKVTVVWRWELDTPPPECLHGGGGDLDLGFEKGLAAGGF